MTTIQKSLCTVATLCAMLAVVVLASCEKAIIDQEETSGDVDGNLTVSVYQIEQMPFASVTRAAVTDYCNRLNFAIYEMDGTRVKQVNQTSDKAGFGTASFSLEEGEYQLVVLAHSSNGNPTMTNPQKIQFSNSLGYTDTFLYYTTVTVTAYDSADNVLYEREFDVPMTRRKITRLSGDFFTGEPGSSGDVGVTISINGDWDGQTDVTY